jgi:hypothetical protein
MAPIYEALGMLPTLTFKHFYAEMKLIMVKEKIMDPVHLLGCGNRFI